MVLGKAKRKNKEDDNVYKTEQSGKTVLEKAVKLQNKLNDCLYKLIEDGTIR